MQLTYLDSCYSYAIVVIKEIIVYMLDWKKTLEGLDCLRCF